MHPKEFTQKWHIRIDDFRKMFPSKAKSTVYGWLAEDCPQDVQEKLDYVDTILESLATIDAGTPDVFETYINLIRKK